MEHTHQQAQSITHFALTHKIVAVTGSSSGIGRAIAIEVARQGADVILHGRSQSAAIVSTQDEIRGLGRECEIFCADFSDPDCCLQLVDQAWSWRGKIDAWINNAGADVLTGTAASWSLLEKLNKLWHVDVASTWMLSRAVAAKMMHLNQLRPTAESGKFSVLNMGWDQAMTGMAGDSGELFSTTKGAIIAMSKSLAQSFAPAVRVNCLAPGWIQTKWGQAASDYWDQRAKQESLMQRWGQADDIASAAAFLCSDAASFISGQTLPVNGGFRYSCQEAGDLDDSP